MENVEELISEANSLQLNDDSRQVSDTVVGCIVHKTEHLYIDCCESQLINKEVNTKYIGQLSRGGLEITSMSLSTVVSHSFAVLDENSPAIRLSNIAARKVGMKFFAKYVNSSCIACQKNTDDFSNRVFKAVCNDSSTISGSALTKKLSKTEFLSSRW